MSLKLHDASVTVHGAQLLRAVSFEVTSGKLVGVLSTIRLAVAWSAFSLRRLTDAMQSCCGCAVRGGCQLSVSA